MADPTEGATAEGDKPKGHRTNVWIPGELWRTFKAERPDANLSAILQQGMRGVLECSHSDLGCLDCAEPFPRHEIEQQGQAKLFTEVMWQLGDLARRGGTAEGAQRVVKDVAERSGVPGASTWTLTRPSREERRANKVKEFPEPKKPAPAPALRAVTDPPAATATGPAS